MGKRRVVTIPLSPPLSLLVSYLVPVPVQLHTHNQTDMSVVMVDGLFYHFLSWDPAGE